jgi:2'-5' RNA ligase
MPATHQTRFFIAIMLPKTIETYAAQVSQHLTERYKMKMAKAAPHITLLPPFLWAPDSIDEVKEAIARFTATQPPIPIEISGFGSFSRRVIYLNVNKTQGLMQLQSDLGDRLRPILKSQESDVRSRPFTPHITVASRNVKRETFKSAWQEFKEEAVEFKFDCREIALLEYRQRWHVIQTFTLNLPAPSTF